MYLIPNLFAAVLASLFSTSRYSSRSILLPTSTDAIYHNYEQGHFCTGVIFYSLRFLLERSKMIICCWWQMSRRIHLSFASIQTSLDACLAVLNYHRISTCGIVQYNLKHASIEIDSNGLLAFKSHVMGFCELIFCETSDDVGFAYFIRTLSIGQCVHIKHMNMFDRFLP